MDKKLSKLLQKKYNLNDDELKEFETELEEKVQVKSEDNDGQEKEAKEKEGEEKDTETSTEKKEETQEKKEESKEETKGEEQKEEETKEETTEDQEQLNEDLKAVIANLNKEFKEFKEDYNKNKPFGASRGSGSDESRGGDGEDFDSIVASLNSRK